MKLLKAAAVLSLVVSGNSFASSNWDIDGGINPTVPSLAYQWFNNATCTGNSTAFGPDSCGTGKSTGILFEQIVHPMGDPTTPLIGCNDMSGFFPIRITCSEFCDGGVCDKANITVPELPGGQPEKTVNNVGYCACP